MLQKEISDVIRRMIQDKFSDLDEHLRQDIERILAKTAQRGMASSGPTLVEIRYRCVEEANERVPIAWQAIIKVIEAVGVQVSDNLSADLKAELTDNLNTLAPSLHSLLSRQVNNAGFENTGIGNDILLKNSVWDAVDRAIKKTEIEVDLYIFSLKKERNLSPTQESAKMNRNETVANPQKVFVVHGRDEAFRETVARFLEKIKLKPIILHEQPNKGRTIIEKFMDYSDVAFAVILLTADDRGGLVSDSLENQKPRARQNVIFELGFFLGLLGRDHVCALYEKGVEIPSDYNGVVFIPLDKAGAWRTLLARELKAANIPVDMNDFF